MGISKYQFQRNLEFASRDALIFADYLVRYGGVPESQVVTLTNEQATLINLADELTKVKKKVNRGDRVYVYFAGHGDIETRNDSTENAMLLLYGASRQDYNATFDKCYLRDMKHWLDSLRQAGAQVVFMADACRSGAFTLIGGQEGRSKLMNGLIEQWEGQIKILSCEPGELSIEGKEFGNGRGLFSYCLVDGLIGMADGMGNAKKDNVITKLELELYLKTVVPEKAKPHIQNPVILGGKGNEPIGTFNPDSLRVYQQHQTRDYSLLTSTQTKGFEADLLRGQDSTNRRLFGLFEQAISNQKLLYPTGRSALDYLRQIPDNLNNENLRGLMKRNLVAALQVRTESLLRPLLEKVREEFKTSIPIAQLDSAIAEMDTSIALLGEGHNLIQYLTARRLFLEGKRLLTTKRERYELNDTLSRIAMTRFRESIRLEPNMPYTYWEMGVVNTILGQMDSSMVYFQKCLELIPNSSSLWKLLGTDYKNRKQLQKALTYYERAHQISPDDLSIQADLAEIFHLLGDEKQVAFYRKKALTEYQRQSGGKAKRETILDLIELLESTKQYSKAINLLQALLKADSTDAEVYFGLFSVFYAQEKSNESITAIEKFIHFYPTFGLAHLFRSFLYYQRYQQSNQPADLRQANESAEECLRLSPGNYVGSPIQYLSFVIRCVFEMEHQNFRAALPFAQRAVQANPSSSDLHLILGKISYRLGDTTQAWLSFTRADSLGADKATTYGWYGQLYEVRKNYEEAEKYYRKADAIQPNNPVILGALMRSLWNQQKNVDETLSLCLRLQKLKHTDEDAWFVAGHLYYRQKRYDEAQFAFSEAFWLNPKRTETLKMIDEIAILTGQFKPAAEAYRRASDLDSTNSIYPNQAGWLYLQIGLPDMAFNMYSRVVAIDTIAYPVAAQRTAQVNDRLAVAYSILGDISMRRNDYHQSIHWAAKAISTMPDSKFNDVNLFKIGWAYNQLNQPAKAISPLQEAIRLNPENIDHRTLLATSLTRSGNAVAGEAEAKIVLQKDSTNIFATQTLAVAVMRQGRYVEAWKLGERLEKISPPNSSEASYFFSRWFARQGKPKEALLQLEKSFKLSPCTDTIVILTNPDFDSIKQDAGFLSLIRTYCPDKK
ncbi:tetratricopeptide repeat protein [Spirosoma panaciterrae]|uniref:tetratricopeptide repeat protein n=1 Tax=Spirosoma panaciterrae TaxID=496058 RepID=UPI00146E7D23|nr:tetratricopeptide repeat protein [Spirosoma panaciterrae]